MDTNLSTWPFHSSLLSDMPENNPIAKAQSAVRKILTRGLNHKHMIETIERFVWEGLPPEIPQDIIERVLYFRFKGSLFYVDKLEKYLFLPFALKGKNADTIDSYGRYASITPVLFTGQWKIGGDGNFTKDVSWITNKSFMAVYDMPADQEGEETADKNENKEDNKAAETKVTTAIKGSEKMTVILTDSSLEISQDYTPMAYLARPFVEELTNIIVLVDIDLINSAKIHTIVAKDEEQKKAIEAEFKGLDQKILNGQRVIVVTAATALQELNKATSKDSARYFQSYQSLDNLRKDLIGEDNGGTFMKQEHTTEMETETNSNSGGSPVLNNALRMRRDFAAIANKVFGLNISVSLKSDLSTDSIAPEGEQTKDRNKEGDEE